MRFSPTWRIPPVASDLRVAPSSMSRMARLRIDSPAAGFRSRPTATRHQVRAPRRSRPALSAPAQPPESAPCHASPPRSGIAFSCPCLRARRRNSRGRGRSSAAPPHLPGRAHTACWERLRTRRRSPHRCRCRPARRRRGRPTRAGSRGPVCCDLEGRQPPRVRLRDGQGGVVGRHGHTIRKGEAVAHLSRGPIACDEGDDPVDAIDVGVAAIVHDDLVPRLVGDAAQVGMGHELPVDLSAQETTLASPRRSGVRAECRPTRRVAGRQPRLLSGLDGSAQRPAIARVPCDAESDPMRPRSDGAH
jgi:hypothetical protein